MDSRLVMPFSLHFDPHQVLGILASSSKEEIREAYYRSAKKYHPDHGGDEWAFRVISTAYEILNNKPAIQEIASPKQEPAHAWPRPDRPRPAATKTNATETVRPIQFNWDALKSQTGNRVPRRRERGLGIDFSQGFTAAVIIQVAAVIIVPILIILNFYIRL